MFRRSHLSAALGYATFVSAMLAIMGAPWATDLDILTGIFRPLTTLLVLAYAWHRGLATPAPRIAVLAGLLIWLVGDVAMLWPQSLFVAGLTFFCLADLAFLWACTRAQRFAAWWPPFLLYLLVGAGLVAAAWYRTPLLLRAPLILYVGVLVLLAAQTAVVWRAARGTEDGPRSLVLALGGVLFMASSAFVVVDRFVAALPLGSLWAMASAWGALWCVASWLSPVRRLSNRPAPSESRVTP